jgi:cytoskeletal protein RodZ
VAKNAYPYPPDEFDQIDISSRPKEVHAARRGAWSRIWPFLLVIILIPAVAFAVVFFFGDRLPGNSAQSPPAEQSDVPETEPADEPIASEDPPVDEPSDPPVEEPPTPVVDKAAKVTVYNNGETAGAAAAGVEKLTGAGYSAVELNKERNAQTVQASTVYYSTEEQAVTAQDVATTLGVTAVELNAQVGGGAIVVILW